MEVLKKLLAVEFAIAEMDEKEMLVCFSKLEDEGERYLCVAHVKQLALIARQAQRVSKKIYDQGLETALEALR